MLWGWPFSTWEMLVKISLWVAGVAGIGAALAAFIAGYVGYELTDAVQRKSDETIAEAKKDASVAQAVAARANEAAAKANNDAGRANERAGKLEAEAAEANERAAKLEKDASHARLEQEQLKSVVQWRHLSDETSKKLFSALSNIPSGVQRSLVFSYAQNDQEAEYFLYQIGRQFIAVGNWNLGMQSRSYAGMLYWGVRILGPDSATTRAIREAFRAADIEFTTDDLPGGFTASGNMASSNDTVILVGPKKPPF